MTSDSPTTTPTPTTEIPTQEVKCDIQINLKQEQDQLILNLPTEKDFKGSWSEIWSQFKHRLNGSERSWQPQTTVHLFAKDRLLDSRQLQAVADALKEVELQLKLVQTSRRQTAVAAATAGYSVKQEELSHSLSSSASEPEPTTHIAEPLYLNNTLRSGVEVRHPGTVILVGDVNPGGSVIATGDILIWGCLRGIAHAGAQGDRQRRIMAIEMKPTQLRIADVVARAPASNPNQLYPEVAYITTTGIRLAKSVDFGKNYSFSSSTKAWQNIEKKYKKSTD